MIDAHTHLYSDKYYSDLEWVIKRARKKLTAVIISAVDSESLRKSLAIKHKFQDFVYVTAGVHPKKAAQIENEELKQMLNTFGRAKSDIVALGEGGP
ncbi:MAG: TatD family hydrolase, partial [Desulfobacterales bacterium]